MGPVSVRDEVRRVPELMIAAIYAHKSTGQTGVADEQKSVGRRVNTPAPMRPGKGWAVGDGHIFIDDGTSGAWFQARPGFLRITTKRLICAACARAVDPRGGASGGRAAQKVDQTPLGK